MAGETETRDEKEPTWKPNTLDALIIDSFETPVPRSGALQIQGKSVLPDYDRINSFARGRCAVCPSDTKPRLRAFFVRRPNSRRPYSEGIDSVVQYQADLP